MNTNQKRELFTDILNFRHATKAFDQMQNISPEDRDFILNAGRLSPSSFGLEPWSLSELRDKDIRQKMIPYAWGCQDHLKNSPLFLIVKVLRGNQLSPPSPYIDALLSNTKSMSPETQSKIKDLISTFIKRDFAFRDEASITEWAMRQSYIMLANMMTAAAFIGIDSCPMEGFELDKISSILSEGGILNPKTEALACMVAFGYRLAEPGRKKTRRNLHDIVSVK